VKLRALVFVCALALATFTPALAAGASEAPLYYVSLGDSLAAGTQPDLAHPGTNIPFTNQSYTDQLFAIERAKLPTLQHVKLACPGETTGTMIADGLAFPGVGVVEGRNPHELCQYVHGSQLAEAVSFLHAHQNFVAFVTIDIGANDVLNLGPTGGAAAIAANLPVILAALRDAAPGVRVIGMNYYDPRLVTWFINPAGLQREVNAAVGFNNFLEAIYGGAGDSVADVEAAFDTTITTPVGSTTTKQVTVSVFWFPVAIASTSAERSVTATIILSSRS